MVVETMAVVAWAWVFLLRSPFIRLHRRIASWFHPGDDHDAGRRAELAWWNDARQYARRQALKAANDLTPSVAEVARTYEGEGFTVYAECVGRPMVLIVGENHSVISNPDNVVGHEGRY